jgi:hypothetical protein
MRFSPKAKPELACSTDPTRHNLHYVYLDTDSSRLVATNGHVLIAEPVVLTREDKAGRVPAAALEAARKAVPKYETHAQLTLNDHAVVPDGPTFPRPDGTTYVDWQRVLPVGDVQFTVSFDAKLLLQLVKAAGTTGKTAQVTLLVRGPLDPIEVKVADSEATCILNS